MASYEEEFLFGRLSSPAGRIEEAREEALGLYDLATLEPLDPPPGEPIRLRFRCGIDVSLSHLFVFWTADGSRPAWSDEAPLGTTRRAEAAVVETAWETIDWGSVQTWEA